VKDNVFDGHDDQEDGIHMNEKGNHILTMKLAQFLNKESPERFPTNTGCCGWNARLALEQYSA
jgi:hypothetical protein